MRPSIRHQRSGSRLAGILIAAVLLATGTRIAPAGAVRDTAPIASPRATPDVAADAPTTTWALSGNGTARGVNHTPGGDAIVTGNFRGTTSLDGVTLTSAGANDAFVFALDPTGAVRWGRSFGGPRNDAGVDVDVARNGDIYVTGQFQGTMEAGPGMRATSRGGSDAFLLKLDPAGTPLWLRTGGGTADDGGDEVSPDRTSAADAEGGVVMMGSFASQPMTIGDGRTIASAGDLDAFLARFDADGNLGYARRVGGAERDIGHGVQADAAGNAVMTGEFRETMIVDGRTYAAPGNPSSFAGAWGPDGRPRWFAVFGSTELTIARAAEIDGGGNVSLGGFFSGTLAVGDLRTTADPGGQQLFLLRLDADGRPEWLVRFGAPGANVGVELQATPSGEVYASGSVDGVADFFGAEGSGVRAGRPGRVSEVVVKYGRDGECLWASVDGAPGRPLNYAIGRSGDGRTVTVGTTDGGAVFGGRALGTEPGFYVAHRAAGPPTSTEATAEATAFTALPPEVDADVPNDDNGL